MFLKAFSLTLAAILRLRLILSSCSSFRLLLRCDDTSWGTKKKQRTTKATKWNEKIKKFQNSQTHIHTHTAPTEYDELREFTMKILMKQHVFCSQFLSGFFLSTQKYLALHIRWFGFVRKKEFKIKLQLLTLKRNLSRGDDERIS
jgi:hypothetical protein